MSWVGASVGGAILGAGAIGAGGALISGLIGADASRDAAGMQADAARDAQRLQWEMYQQGRSDLAPWRTAGEQGLNALLPYLGIGPGGFDPNAPGVRPFGMADFQADPGYQFRLKEGLGAVLNRSSALGGLMGGNTLRALTEYGQGLAGQTYDAARQRYREDQALPYNVLSGLSNTGANVAGQITGLGANAAARSGEYGTQVGNALAAGQIGQGQAWTNAIGGATNNWLLANYLQQRRGPGGGGWVSGYDLPMGP